MRVRSQADHVTTGSHEQRQHWDDNQAAFTREELVEITHGQWVGSLRRSHARGVSTDTRTLRPGMLYMALSGPRYDGHDYLREAAARGAWGVVVRQGQHRPSLPTRCGVIEVNDPLVALGQLATAHRQRWSGTVIGISGTVGKTTTKEMIGRVLQTHCRVLRTEGTLNNLVGVPLTLLRLRSHHAVAVVELGANAPGDLMQLAAMAQPNVAVLTNVGPAHLDQLGNQRGVFREKASLAEWTLDAGGRVWLNGDDPWFATWAAAAQDERLQTYGTSRGHTCWSDRVDTVGPATLVRVRGRWWAGVRVPPSQASNAMAAIALGEQWGCTPEAMRRRLAGFQPAAWRLQPARTRGIDFLLDCYNANPLSMRSVLEVVQHRNGHGKKFLVLGDMLELGQQSRDWHRWLGVAVAQASPDALITVGRRARDVLSSARDAGLDAAMMEHRRTPLDAAQLLLDTAQRGDLVVVKGSRALKLEEVYRCFTTSGSHS